MTMLYFKIPFGYTSSLLYVSSTQFDIFQCASTSCAECCFREYGDWRRLHERVLRVHVLYNMYILLNMYTIQVQIPTRRARNMFILLNM